MIELKDVLNIHNILIYKFGGSKGIRDSGLLESAINRPFATFDKHDLYPSPAEKAAAILESILYWMLIGFRMETYLTASYAVVDDVIVYRNLHANGMINHPFVDGNKRSAYVLMRLILLDNGFDIVANQDEKYKMVISASKGDLRYDDIRNWIQTRLIKKNEE